MKEKVPSVPSYASGRPIDRKIPYKPGRIHTVLQVFRLSHSGYVLEELENGFGSFCGIDGRGDNAVDVLAFQESGELGEELVETFAVVLADLESGVDEQVGHVVVGSEDTCDEAVEGLSVSNSVFFGVDETCGVLDVELELVTLFDADNGTLAGVKSVVYEFDEGLGLAGTFFADEKFNLN
ncbi:MAG: hypothetical protein IJX93_10435 [Clostridia bacterium]|nr:hypothetical protein [Clostridia bacterium]